jgi:carbonic anhydrase/acetyltransferase-like protein (isoleucine patch superfamily)
MIRANVVGDKPNIDSTSFVDPSAIIIGRVDIGPNCYIGPAVVIRADRFSSDDSVARIVLGANCGIQDGAVLHVHAEDRLEIGDCTLINHGAVIHGPSVIGSNCFIGCKSVITHARIGDRVFVRSNAIVEEVFIEPGRFLDVNVVINTPEAAAALRSITDEEKAFMDRAVLENREYPVRYKYSLEK